MLILKQHHIKLESYVRQLETGKVLATLYAATQESSLLFNAISICFLNVSTHNNQLLYH